MFQLWGTGTHIKELQKEENSASLYASRRNKHGRIIIFSARHIPALQTTWLLDSGATNHMAKEESMFSDLDKSVHTSIKMANGEKIMSIGIGNIIVETLLGQITIRDVVPKISRNLLSVGQLVRTGYKVLFDDKKGNIMDIDYRKIIEASMNGTSFSLSWSITEKDDSSKEKDRSKSNHEIAIKQTKSSLATTPPQENTKESEMSRTPNKVRVGSTKAMKEGVNVKDVNNQTTKIKEKVWELAMNEEFQIINKKLTSKPQDKTTEKQSIIYKFKREKTGKKNYL